MNHSGSGPRVGSGLLRAAVGAVHGWAEATLSSPWPSWCLTGPGCWRRSAHADREPGYRRLRERCRPRRRGGSAGRDWGGDSGSLESGSSSMAPASWDGFGFRGSRTPAPPPPRLRRHRFQNRGRGLCTASLPRSGSTPGRSSVMRTSLLRVGYDGYASPGEMIASGTGGATDPGPCGLLPGRHNRATLRTREQ